jgi:hypothetical protein
MNLATHEWFLFPGRFPLLVPCPAFSIERTMGDLEEADWSDGVTGKERCVNATN